MWTLIVGVAEVKKVRRRGGHSTLVLRDTVGGDDGQRWSLTGGDFILKRETG